MPANYALDAVRRSNRSLLIICLVGILIVAGAAALSYRYLVNFVRGPVPTASQDVVAIKDVNNVPQYWVTVSGDDSSDTGMQEVKTSSGSSTKTVTASFVSLAVGDKQLLVKVPGDISNPGTKYTGALVDIPSDVNTQVVTPFEQENNLSGAVLPFMLDTSDFRSGGYLGIGIGAIVLLLCLWGLSRAISRSANPLRHPVMRALARFGEPNAVSQQINAEMAAPHQTIGDTHLTPHWVVVSKGGSFAATRFQDIAWLYAKVTQHRTNGIPAGKTYSALFWDRYGTCLTVNAKQQVTDEVLKAVYSHAPWALAGYNADMQKAWKSNRAAVLSAVDQRKSQAVGQASTPVTG